MDDTNNPRIEQLLEETLEVAQENNEMLRSIQRTTRWAFWVKFLIWIVVLGLPLLFIGPILDALLPVPLAEGGTGGIFGLPSPEQIQALMEVYGASGAGIEAP